LICENGDGQQIQIGPGDTVIFYENERHRVAVLGNEPVELLCIIDCPGDGEDCIPDQPQRIDV
jgi:quercetin dioxygenase-like cupin family protein